MGKDIAYSIVDCIVGRPYGFKVGEERFYLYPQTLGMLLMMQRVMNGMKVNDVLLKTNPSVEALRIASYYREECIRIIFYNTCKGVEVLDEDLYEHRAKTFDEKLGKDDIASLMVIILTAHSKEVFMKYLGIDAEIQELKAVNRAKSTKNNLSFGGKSMFGTILDVACERYGWTKDYVVWGIDYVSLQLMLADKINSIFISDEEAKRIPLRIMQRDGDIIKATKENMETILNMGWK